MMFESRNPATGDMIKTYPSLTTGEIEKKLDLAWKTWKTWSNTPFKERTALLSRMAASAGVPNCVTVRVTAT